MNWALGGYKRLRASRTFKQPEASKEATEDLVRLASPVKAFMEDACTIDPVTVNDEQRHVITEDELHRAFIAWADTNSVQRMRKGDFIEAAAVVTPLVAKHRPRHADPKAKRERCFRGIALNTAPTDHLDGIM